MGALSCRCGVRGDWRCEAGMEEGADVDCEMVGWACCLTLCVEVGGGAGSCAAVGWLPRRGRKGSCGRGRGSEGMV